MSEELSAKSDTRQAVSVYVPVMTKERFCTVSGMREGQVRSQIERFNIPTIKIGRLTMVNLIAFTWDGHNTDLFVVVPCPVMTQERFADATGLREEQVTAQVRMKNLDITPVGRLVMVDVAKLANRCRAECETALAAS